VLTERRQVLHRAVVAAFEGLARVDEHVDRPDAALAPLQEAVARVTRLDHPLSMVLAQSYAALIHYHRGDRAAAREAAERVVSLAITHGFVSWIDDGATMLACLEASEIGDGRRLADVLASMTARGGRAAWRQVVCLTRLAEAFGWVGEPARGLAALDTIAEPDRHAIYAPEIERVRGELLVHREEPAAADGHFRRAIEVARRRGERSFELRAATSLARLLADRGAREPARQVLAPVYAAFTEGFATADLRSARALLDALGG
jgi:tetratricopeptide (TPR) repeat protein